MELYHSANLKLKMLHLFYDNSLALAKSIVLKEKVQNLSEQLHKLEIENERLISHIKESKRYLLIPFILSLIAVILVGLGINIVTDKSDQLIGRALIVLAVIIEFLIYYLNLQQSKE
jgi:hypothetical protein